MAHVIKINRASVGAVLAHNNRSFVNHLHDKSHINAGKSSKNYNLCENSINGDYKYYDARIKELKVLNRKDVNTLCEWVVTLPKTLPEDKEDLFFKYCYEFMVERYGYKNIISAYVHKDEKQPHIHVDFIPVCKGFKKSKGVKTEIEKVSAKEVINELELQKFHPELKKYLEYKLHCRVDVLNEQTIEENKTVKELKAESAKKAEKILNGYFVECNKILNELNEAVNNKTNKNIMKTLPHWEYSKKMFSEDKSKIVFEKSDFLQWINALNAEYNDMFNLSENYKNANKEISQLETNLQKYSEIEEENERLKKELKKFSEYIEPVKYVQKIKDIQKERYEKNRIKEDLERAIKLKEKYKNTINTIKKYYPKLISNLEKDGLSL